MLGKDGAPERRTTTSSRATVRPLVLRAAQRDRLAVWARDAYPHEACGLLLGHAEPGAVRVDCVERARNLERERARTHYTLSPEDHFRIEREAHAAGLDVVGVWHSHPDRTPYPSRADLDGAHGGRSYLILSTAGAQVSSAVPFRSWRLGRTGFIEEPIEILRAVPAPGSPPRGYPGKLVLP